MRVALGVEYRGTDFHGWQIQPGVSTVQETVETALSTVADHPVRVICAGRTDAGVHASGQVIHMDTKARRDMRSWVFGANANLPVDVTVLWAQPVTGDFHARFSAIRRCYRYIIFNRNIRPALHGFGVTWDYRALDADRMASAAFHLVGEHDFTSYRALECQARNPVRTIHRLDVTRRGAYVFLDIEANGFLHHMVRNIAGVLMTIGAGEHDPVWSREVLEMQDRARGGITAPPNGLYLTGVCYPQEFAIPASAPVLTPW